MTRIKKAKCNRRAPHTAPVKFVDSEAPVHTFSLKAGGDVTVIQKTMIEKTMRATPIVRFGLFEVDLRSGELSKSGLKVKLQEKPFQMLAALLERPGEAVSKEELREKLWGPDTFVEFNSSLKMAAKSSVQLSATQRKNPVLSKHWSGEVTVSLPRLKRTRRPAARQ